MKTARKHCFAFVASMMLAQVLAVLFAARVSSGQQNPPLLQITSPTTGTIVNPGQTISVTVTSPANDSFSQVGVVGEDPIDFSSVATSVPAQFSMSIPNDIACRKFMLTAVGATSSGQSAQSATILIDVERPDMPTAVNPQIPALTFKAVGAQFPLVLLATFSDGSVLDVTESSNVTYSSANTSVATVDANGMVTGGSAGDTTITATYGLNGQNIQAAIPVTVPPPVMAVSPVSLTFGSQNVGTASSAQQLTVTNSSNGDMKIVGVSATGDFAETDNCVSSSPVPANGTCAP